MKKCKCKSCFSFVQNTKINELQMLYNKIILTIDKIYDKINDIRFYIMIDILKMIVNHYFFNNNKKFRKIIQQFMKHIIFVNVN